MSTNEESWYAQSRPWIERNSDLGLFGTPTEYGLKPYWLFFVFLRMSPSYELARAETSGEDVAGPWPADFRAVLDTYLLFGDVSKTFFTVWWRERAAKVFGNPSEFRTLNDPRLKQPLRPRIELARKPDIPALDRWAKAMNMEAAKEAGEMQVMDGKPTHWRLAAWLDPTSFHARSVDADKGERSTDKSFHSDEEAHRRHLTQTFRRDLRTAEAVAENAARGRFPLTTPKPEVRFDYAAIGKRLAAIAECEAEIKSRPRRAV